MASVREKTIAVITLPKVSNAIGGEDQVGQYLVEAFESLGHRCMLFYEHESALIKRYKFDMVLSNNSITSIKGHNGPAVFWHFNERIRLSDCVKIKSLGYTHIASNQPSDFFTNEDLLSIERSGLPVIYLPLAASNKMINDDPVPCTDGSVCYVGNWNHYKGDKIDKWLTPLMDCNLNIYGGHRWADHPRFSHFYRGILPKDNWQSISSMHDTWVSFRSPEQENMGMTPDRLFWLLAAGVNRVVSDTPVAREIGGHIIWSSPSTVVEDIKKNPPMHGKNGACMVKGNHTYEARMRTLLDWLDA